MREIRLSGSEGGEPGQPGLPTPIVIFSNVMDPDIGRSGQTKETFYDSVKFYVLSFKGRKWAILHLKTWKFFNELAVFAVRVYEELKRCKDFGLKDQMTRAAVSIASNIAEGAEGDTAVEFTRFLHIATGSAAESSDTVV